MRLTPDVVAIAAYVLALPGGDMDSGVALVEKAIALNPNSAHGIPCSGRSCMDFSVRPKKRLITRNGLTGSTHWTPVGAGIWDT